MHSGGLLEVHPDTSLIVLLYLEAACMSSIANMLDPCESSARCGQRVPGCGEGAGYRPRVRRTATTNTPLALPIYPVAPVFEGAATTNSCTCAVDEYVIHVVLNAPDGFWTTTV